MHEPANLPNLLRVSLVKEDINEVGSRKACECPTLDNIGCWATKKGNKETVEDRGTAVKQLAMA